MDAAFINEGNYVVAWPQSTWRRFSFSRGDFSCSRGHNVPGGVLGFPCLPCPHPDHRQKQTTSASTTLTFHPHQNPQKWVFLEHWLERERKQVQVGWLPTKTEPGVSQPGPWDSSSGVEPAG